MAFPATYNINYYMGDTHEFRIYPKDSSGAAFPLSQYPTVKFTIAERRGTPLPDDAEPVEAYAAFSNDRTNILCAIDYSHAANLDPAKQYVYDVQISKSGIPYDSVLTLITGNISITDQVTLITTDLTAAAPGTVVSLNVDSVTDSSVTVEWSAPTEGGTPTGYYAYIVEYNPSYEDPTTLAALISALGSASPVDTTDTGHTFVNTTAVPSLGITSEPLSANTAYIYAVVAYNNNGSSDAVGNFNVTAGTIDEVFTDSGS